MISVTGLLVAIGAGEFVALGVLETLIACPSRGFSVIETAPAPLITALFALPEGASSLFSEYVGLGENFWSSLAHIGHHSKQPTENKLATAKD